MFPEPGAYAGAVFSFLLGLLAARVSLAWVLRLPAGKLRDFTALPLAILPAAFMTCGRLEALGVVLFPLPPNGFVLLTSGSNCSGAGACVPSRDTAALFTSETRSTRSLRNRIADWMVCWPMELAMF